MLLVGKLLTHAVEHPQNGLVDLIDPVLALAIQAFLESPKAGQTFLDFFSLSHFCNVTVAQATVQATTSGRLRRQPLSMTA